MVKEMNKNFDKLGDEQTADLRQAFEADKHFTKSAETDAKLIFGMASTANA